jgi:sugar phosphate isomerase/epimerase
MNNPILMHITLAEQGQKLPEICLLAKRCGYDGIEFRNSIREYDSKPEAYLDAIVSATERCTIQQVLFGVEPNLMSSDSDQRKREVDRVLNFCRLASKRFRLSVLNTCAGSLKDPKEEYVKYDRHGSAIAKAEHFEWASGGYKVLAACAAEFKFRFAFETHMAYLHDLPAPTCRLMEAIGSEYVGVNLDYANIVAFPKVISLEETISLFDKRIYYVHLKNLFKISGIAYDNCIRCGLADGIVNTRELLRRLSALNYQGPLAIEAPRSGDREWFARQDITYLRSVMADIA